MARVVDQAAVVSWAFSEAMRDRLGEPFLWEILRNVTEKLHQRSEIIRTAIEKQQHADMPDPARLDRMSAAYSQASQEYTETILSIAQACQDSIVACTGIENAPLHARLRGHLLAILRKTLPLILPSIDQTLQQDLAKVDARIAALFI
jgi:hypothetical protein